MGRREKLAYALPMRLDNKLKFWDCVEVFNDHTKCQEAMQRECVELQPKCCRCKTSEPIPSNGNHGCLLEIFKGDSYGAACQLLDVSSGRYDCEWFGSGKNNYRFYGNCSEAEPKGGDTFTQHDMCPTPWTEWD